LLQLFALFYFVKILIGISKSSKLTFEKWHFNLWGIAFLSLAFKMLIQTFVAIPYLATISYTIRNFVIGFVHLLMLGALSAFVFGLMRFLNIRVSRLGITIFLAAILLTELMLFGQGLLIWMRLGFIPYYYILIAVFSLLFPLGIGIILYNFRFDKI
ncbi:MAG: hypothetical protein KJN84_14855, partial [Bacteroidia bacterium]|nr:hypothetical protein [Bacteroidia bacterium]